MQDLSTEKIDELRQAARTVVRELGLLGDAYFEIGVTLAERHLLIEIARSRRPDMQDMVERLLLDKSTVSRLIAKTVKKGFVDCMVDRKDKRRRCLKLTQKGREALQRIEPLAQKQVKAALLTLDEEERESVYRGILLFAKSLIKARLCKNQAE